MAQITFKDGYGEEVTTEVANVVERLRELNAITAKKVAEDAPIRPSDVARFNEVAAIEVLIDAQRNRDFLTPVIEMLIAEGAGSRWDALQLIDTFTMREGWWCFCQRVGALDLSNSAEEFSLQFMTAYNKEVYPRY